MQDFVHIPVLLNEVLELLTFPADRPVRLIDGTIGGGGHSSALLSRYRQLELLGIDRDDAALSAAQERLQEFGSRVHLFKGNYSELAGFAGELGWDKVDGILLDIGVSSPQLDHAERGFSWRNCGPLDMRMNQNSPLTAGRVLNRYAEEDLARIFRDYGELPSARKLARAVVEQRKSEPFGTTEDLVALCDRVLGKSRPGKLPAPTLVFQALRIEVNEELEELKKALVSAVGLLETGGRIAVISFHSLEDRIVKNFFRDEAVNCICPPKLPVCCCGHRARLRLVEKHPRTAGESELEVNRRAACAKLRVAERI